MSQSTPLTIYFIFFLARLGPRPPRPLAPDLNMVQFLQPNPEGGWNAIVKSFSHTVSIKPPLICILTVQKKKRLNVQHFLWVYHHVKYWEGVSPIPWVDAYDVALFWSSGGVNDERYRDIAANRWGLDSEQTLRGNARRKHLPLSVCRRHQRHFLCLATISAFCLSLFWHLRGSPIFVLGLLHDFSNITSNRFFLQTSHIDSLCQRCWQICGNFAMIR